MTTATEQALAVLFRRFKETPVPRNDLVKAVSLELDWTKPSKAENLLDRGLNAGYLEDNDEGLSPRFDPGEIEVPFGFAPDEELFEPVETVEGDEAESEGEGSGGEAGGSTAMLEALLDRIAQTVDGDRKQAVAAANARQEAMGDLVTIETAALLVAHGEGLDVEEEAEQVLAQLRDT